MPRIHWDLNLPLILRLVLFNVYISDLFFRFFEKNSISISLVKIDHGVNGREPEGALGHCHKHNVRVSYFFRFVMYI